MRADATPQKQAMVTIGVDVGGTFTDLVLRDERAGEVVVAKIPTTPSDPEQGVLAAVDAAVGPEDLGRCTYFVHGTTVGLNALIERRGATVGLLTTRGFRDVLEVRHGDRDDPYDLFWTPPPPLVPRRLRQEVVERITAQGQVETPLDPSSVLDALACFRTEGVDAIAVSLLNNYADPAHELEVESILREAGFDGDLSLSHRVSGVYREYERTSTTVIDAFVRRRMGPYLRRLSSGLKDRGFVGELLVTRSGGGAATIAEALRRPFETILSGPVAGAAATARLASVLDEPLLVVADVGGTSFDTAIIRDGRLPLLFEGAVAGMPVQCPWVDVRSIGSGGGSIAHVDAGGLLQVGPRSAGSDPGPASYQRGGTEPTTTDAALLLGMLRPGRLSGGVELDPARAEAALAPLAARAGLRDASDVAQGVLRIAVSQMAGAIRSIAAEQGVDPRETTLVAFGGAGPMFGCLLASELGAPRVVVPPNAGNFSAVGLMQADVTRSASRTVVAPLDDVARAQIAQVSKALLASADDADQAVGADLDREPGLGPDVEERVLVDLRYIGQEHTLTVTAGTAGEIATTERIREVFVEEYRRTYSHELPEPLELVAVRVERSVRLQRERGLVPARAWSTPASRTRLWSFRLGGYVDAPVLARVALAAEGAEGPLLVVEETTTTYVDSGFAARRGPDDSLILTRVEAA